MSTGAIVRIPVGAMGRDFASAASNRPADMPDDVRFVCRYIAKLPNAKVIKRAEVDLLHGRGVAILLNWEQTETDPLEGAPTGTDHGQRAKKIAGDLGYPTSLPIIASVDFQPVGNQMDSVLAYMRAFAKAIDPYPLGVYAGTPVINACHDDGISVFGWRALASSWSSGVSSDHVHIRQSKDPDSTAFDRNKVLIAFDAWLPGGRGGDVTPGTVTRQPKQTTTPTPVTEAVGTDFEEEDGMRFIMNRTSDGASWLVWASGGKVAGMGMAGPVDVIAATNGKIAPVWNCSDAQVEFWLQRIERDKGATLIEIASPAERVGQPPLQRNRTGKRTPIG